MCIYPAIQDINQQISTKYTHRRDRIAHTGITLGGGSKLPPTPPKYFFNLGIFWSLNRRMANIKRQKKENEKVAFYGMSFPLFQI
jgi:hypothetical protein